MSAWLRDDPADRCRDDDAVRHLRPPAGGRPASRGPGHRRRRRLARLRRAPTRAATLALWEARPTAPGVLPCGTAFDVVNVPALFGRRMLDRLWEEGPGSGPVAMHRGRMLLFAAPGTAQRLPSLLDWEEWGDAVAADCSATASATR